MVCAPMQASVSLIIGNHMKNEEFIRDLLLFQKEMILHESYSSINIPLKFIKIPDEERRGMIRALRWVLEDDIEDLS